MFLAAVSLGGIFCPSLFVVHVGQELGAFLETSFWRRSVVKGKVIGEEQWHLFHLFSRLFLSGLGQIT